MAKLLIIFSCRPNVVDLDGLNDLSKELMIELLKTKMSQGKIDFSPFSKEAVEVKVHKEKKIESDFLDQIDDNFDTIIYFQIFPLLGEAEEKIYNEFHIQNKADFLCNVEILAKKFGKKKVNGVFLPCLENN